MKSKTDDTALAIFAWTMIGLPIAIVGCIVLAVSIGQRIDPTPLGVIVGILAGLGGWFLVGVAYDRIMKSLTDTVSEEK